MLATTKAGELPKLFVRTDRAERRALSGTTAMAQTMAKAPPKPMPGAVAVARTLAKKHSSTPPVAA